MLELNKVHHGDCMELIRQLPDKSVNSVITSPPYWQLRDYGWNGQWGLEPTFLAYLEHLWELMDETHRILTDDGTVWVNLGDTYGSFRGKSGSGSDKFERESGLGKRETPKHTVDRPNGMRALYDKCLLLIPHRFAIGCIDRGWIMRNDIIWAKRNGMPESVTDRFSKKHEYFFLMAKNEKYYFDLDSIRENYKESSINRLMQNVDMQLGSSRGNDGGYKTNGNMKACGNITTKIPADGSELFGSPRARQHRAPKFGGNKGSGQDHDGVYSGNEWTPRSDGKNPGDVSDFWDIPTKGSADKHYAAYNTKLIDKPIMAGCPKGGIILDPFCGTATTGCRAIDLGRKFIGFEGSAEYVKIAEKKLEHYIISQQLF